MLNAIRKNAVAQLLGGNIHARSSFIRAINLLQAQGKAEQLRKRVQGVMKLDGEAVA